MQVESKKVVEFQMTVTFTNAEVRALRSLGDTSNSSRLGSGMSPECSNLLEDLYWKVQDLFESPE